MHEVLGHRDIRKTLIYTYVLKIMAGVHYSQQTGAFWFFNSESTLDSPNRTRHSMSTYSIALRVRRITYEDAYVAVPVTDAIMKKKTDGSIGIDSAAFVTEGIRISQDSRIEWQIESISTESHPIQQPAPADRKKFDAFYDGPENHL